MINIQKRYIYSAILSGCSFIIFYAIMDFYLWIALLFSIGFYIGGVFLFKSKDIRVYDEKALAKYYFEMSKLNDYKDRLKDKNIKEKITNIVEVCHNLTKYLETKPTNATQIYNSLDYYLSFATARITEYMKIENVKEKTFTENQLVLKINVYLKEIVDECEKLYKQAIDSKEKIINYEMKKFERLSTIENDEKGSEK